MEDENNLHHRSQPGNWKELARQLLIKGNIVIASCRNPEKRKASALQSEFNKLEIVGLSVDDENSVLSCFNKLKDDNRKIDLLLTTQESLTGKT